MEIKELRLSNFRGFTRKDIKFSSDITVIIGPNASGKTNIIESLFLLSTGKSFHAHLEEEMVNYNEDIARVKGLVDKINLEVILTRGEIGIGEGKIEKTPRKKLLINGVSRRLLDFVGNFKTVLFGPWDMDLVTSSPSLRRKFLDTVLFQTDRGYRGAILSYEKGLRQRNKLLLRIREEGIPRSQLLFWNKLLIKNGDYISRSREDFIAFVNTKKPLSGHTFKLEYDKSAISEGRLEQYAREEVAAATTLVGPHRDDFQFSLITSQLSKGQEKAGRDLAKYGSRGEQRMGILWLKMAELSFIEEQSLRLDNSRSGLKPTLLLDDIFSELDHEHRDIVMQAAKNQQTIITTADKHFIEGIDVGDIIELDK